MSRCAYSRLRWSGHPGSLCTHAAHDRRRLVQAPDRAVTLESTRPHTHTHKQQAAQSWYYGITTVTRRRIRVLKQGAAGQCVVLIALGLIAAACSIFILTSPLPPSSFPFPPTHPQRKCRHRKQNLDIQRPLRDAVPHHLPQKRPRHFLRLLPSFLLHLPKAR